MSVARDALLRTKRLAQCIAENDGRVLHRVMRINVQIANRFHLQIDQAVAGK